eukprot:TRINITY_DN15622_c0_g1_i1.p1 TRINITY_DN15622_c0_g1~~TRINITY_DN15622_c0_g1_i1.p1  ORF type:complete len:224 (-),score=86.25 TRINITY_DN15622_c0_g1_i1:687-1358(-)
MASSVTAKEQKVAASPETSSNGVVPVLLCLTLVGAAAANVFMAKRIRYMMPPPKQARWQPADDLRAAQRAAAKRKYDMGWAEREEQERAAAAAQKAAQEAQLRREREYRALRDEMERIRRTATHRRQGLATSEARRRGSAPPHGIALLPPSVALALRALGFESLSGVTEASVKRAYLAKAQELHPDKHRHRVESEAARRRSEERFKEVAEAYQHLLEHYFNVK